MALSKCLNTFSEHTYENNSQRKSFENTIFLLSKKTYISSCKLKISLANLMYTQKPIYI